MTFSNFVCFFYVLDQFAFIRQSAKEWAGGPPWIFDEMVGGPTSILTCFDLWTWPRQFSHTQIKCSLRVSICKTDFVKTNWRLASETQHYYISIQVNHSFLPNCRFESFDHPRFGPIPCIATTGALKCGDELTAYYNYSMSECPEWYSQLWEAQRYGGDG